NPQLLPGRRSINGCPLLRVCVTVCVCSLLCVCTLDGLNAEDSKPHSNGVRNGTFSRKLQSNPSINSQSSKRSKGSSKSNSSQIPTEAQDDCCVHCILACLFCEFLTLCNIVLDCATCGSCASEFYFTAQLTINIYSCLHCLEICMECCGLCFSS
uniref:MyoD family inhibitor-like n=1 Tax=Sinocyclocheilus rhinocerous TaxID=307959 RepID=A0A673KTF1_9TELE